MIHQEENGVSSCLPYSTSPRNTDRRSTLLPLSQIPLIDTRSCTADFRTNSFVGTEGELLVATRSVRFKSGALMLWRDVVPQQSTSLPRSFRRLAIPPPLTGGRSES